MSIDTVKKRERDWLDSLAEDIFGVSFSDLTDPQKRKLIMIIDKITGKTHG